MVYWEYRGIGEKDGVVNIIFFDFVLWLLYFFRRVVLVRFKDNFIFVFVYFNLSYDNLNKFLLSIYVIKGIMFGVFINTIGNFFVN